MAREQMVKHFEVKFPNAIIHREFPFLVEFIAGGLGTYMNLMQQHPQFPQFPQLLESMSDWNNRY